MAKIRIKKLEWSQAAADFQEAKEFKYAYRLEGEPPGTQHLFENVVVSGKVSPFTVETLLPHIPTGVHNIFLITIDNDDNTSTESAPFAVTVVAPTAPTNIKIKSVESFLPPQLQWLSQ